MRACIPDTSHMTVPSQVHQGQAGASMLCKPRRFVSVAFFLSLFSSHSKQRCTDGALPSIVGLEVLIELLKSRSTPLSLIDINSADNVLQLSMRCQRYMPNRNEAYTKLPFNSFSPQFSSFSSFSFSPNDVTASFPTKDTLLDALLKRRFFLSAVHTTFQAR